MDEKSPLTPLSPTAAPDLISAGHQDRTRARLKVWAITGTGGAVAVITIGALGVGLAPSATTSAPATTTTSAVVAASSNASTPKTVPAAPTTTSSATNTAVSGSGSS
jgi:hypothetical protein